MALDHKPVAVPRITVAPGHDIHGFALEIDNTPGSLAKVLNALSRLKINVLQLLASPVEIEAPTAPVYMVVDLTNIATPLEEIISELGGVPTVRSLEHIPPTLPGYLVDKFHFPLLIPGGLRVIGASEVFWRSILETGYNKLGAPVMETFLWYLGEGVGRSLADYWARLLKATGQCLITILLGNGKALGWWDGEAQVDWPKSVVITLRGCWEGLYAKKWAAGCHLLRGLFQGFISQTFGRDVKLVEESCISRGDECCQFIYREETTG